METPTDEELVIAFKEIFDMTRIALSRLEEDMENEDNDIKQYALYVSKLYVGALLDLKDKLDEKAH